MYLKSPFLAAFLLLGLTTTLLTTGCNSKKFKGFTATKMSASGIASAAFNQYDKNSDGFLDKTELKACPGILALLTEYDTDGDSKISLEELGQGFERLCTDGTSYVSVECTVKNGNSPVSGATVKYVPEGFMGEGFHPAEGVTNRQGVAIISIADELVPEVIKEDRKLMLVGVYRVEVTAEKKKASFGHEVNHLRRNGTTVAFDLKKGATLPVEK